MASYKKMPLSFGRRMVAASASVTKDKNAIHCISEVDITKPRDLIKKHFEKTGEKLSLTAYIVACLSNVIKDYPQFNSFIKGKKLILLDDITISVLIEREIDGGKVPEPIGIQKAQYKTYLQMHKEIREAKNQQTDKLGSLSGKIWINLIPSFFLRLMIRMADKNIYMAKKYGKIAVTAIGMYCKEPIWCIPHGSATVLLTIGSIDKKVIELDNQFVSREHLCLSVSFDHDIIDGAPASRFMNDLINEIKSGENIEKCIYL
ncbi:MAG TPA: 2-oxo acid dehydrogenase subunit E2 [Bacteroidales bacterium]|nr:2-oxo acid dehydrogenase subunit E2 [Bacteroidales bacterium]